MALGTITDVQARVGGAQALLRLFDRDRDGVADTAIFAAAAAYATAQIYSVLGASYGGVAFDAPGPVPVLITDLWARLVIGYAGEMFPGAKAPDGAPYAGMKKSALDDLKALATNTNAQLPSGPPAPYSGGAAFVSAPTPVFGAAASGPEGDPDNLSVNGAGGRYSGF